MTSIERGSPSTPESAVWMWNTGIASTTSTLPAAIAETSGRLSTRSSTHDHTRGSPVRLSGLRNGTRPLLTRSPSFDSTAGSTVSEPITAIATTRIVPVANEMNVGGAAEVHAGHRRDHGDAGHEHRTAGGGGRRLERGLLASARRARSSRSRRR